MGLSMDLTEHYLKYFYFIKADTSELLEQAFRLRYEVYFKGCGYKFHNPYAKDRIEKDVYDKHARHCLVFHKHTNKPIAYVRVIPYNEKSGMLLPIESFGIDFNRQTLKQIRNAAVGEVSRLSIIPAFRRRNSDQSYQFKIPQNPSDNRFSINYLPICLVLATMIIMRDNDLLYSVALMEKRLVVLLKKYGVVYEQIGHSVNLNGIRTPYLFCQETYNNLSPEFKQLYKLIENELTSNSSSIVNAEQIYI